MSDRIDNLLRQGEVLAVYDGAGVMRLDLAGRDNERLTGVPYFQPRGFSASPAVGDIVLVLCEGGELESATALCLLDKTNRPKGLGAGELALFNEGRAGLANR